MGTDPTPTFGLTRRTGKPARIACGELSRAINSLDAHHTQETAVTETAVSLLLAEAEAEPVDTRTMATAQARRAERTAVGLRTARAELLECLLALREPLVDVLFEAQSLLPSNAVFGAHVEADTLPGAPQPIGGLDLNLGERLQMLGDTVRWTRRVSHGYAIVAVGPCYLLAYIIEHPVAEAAELRARLMDAHSRLIRFASGTRD